MEHESHGLVILTYSLPLQRIYLTGRNANPANTLNATKVANAIPAATYKLDCTNAMNYPGVPVDDGSRRLRSGGALRRRQGTGHAHPHRQPRKTP